MVGGRGAGEVKEAVAGCGSVAVSSSTALSESSSQISPAPDEEVNTGPAARLLRPETITKGLSKSPTPCPPGKSENTGNL